MKRILDIIQRDKPKADHHMRVRKDMKILKMLVLFIMAGSLSGCFYYGFAKAKIEYRKEENKSYENVVANPTLESCRSYLKNFSYVQNSSHKKHVLNIMEPFLFEYVMKNNTEKDYVDYLMFYPKGYRSNEVREKLEPLFFQRVSEEDFCSDYQSYLRWLPNGAHAKKVKERIAWLKARRAAVVVDYPRVVERNSSGRWSWDTVFKETGNEIGFKVSGEGYMLDRWGHKWGPQGFKFSRKEIKIPAGGSLKDEDWFSSKDHTFCNGFYILDYTGEDAGGNRIEFQIRVYLRHTGCPGHTKGR